MSISSIIDSATGTVVSQKRSSFFAALVMFSATVRRNSSAR
jgi:hypothetical protein